MSLPAALFVPAPPTPVPTDVTPPLPTVLAAGAGFATFGLCAALGAWESSAALRAVPATLAIAAGPFLLTTPALLVVHQLLGLQATPDQVVGAAAESVVRAGRLALGLAPTALFVAATSDLALPLYIAAGIGIGTYAVLRAAISLDRAERSVGGRTAVSPLVAAAWAFLCGLIGLRIALVATTWTFFG